MGAWFRHASPATRVIGVVATGAPTMLRSFQAREPVACESAATIADGIAVRVPVPYAVREMRWTVDEVVAVDDATVIRAMRLLHEQLGVVVEPAGAAGVAALLQYPERWPGARVLTPLCGGNVTPSQAAEWLLRRDEV
jgi:threonine dehydratase